MRVAIAGGTGMIGAWVAHALRSRGDEVFLLTRGSPEAEGDVQWSLRRGIHDVSRLDGLDAVINLTGAPIADRPWTKARRRVLHESRIDATRSILDSLTRLSHGPSIYVGAGGLGRFGDREEEILDDAAEPGSGFLAELACAWEDAHLAAGEQLDCRAAVLRMSICLSPTGGVFPLMVKTFRLGIGGWLGNGRQFTSWISIRDAVGAFLHLLDTESCSGAFNGTLPEPTRNKEWCKALGRVLHRPVLTHAPKWALRGALGELADELFLASVRAVPKKLQMSGYQFVDTDVEHTFAWLVEQLDRSDDDIIALMPRRRQKRIERRRGKPAADKAPAGPSEDPAAS